MSNIREFDVIVVGGGQAGGLPAAAYLQKAGARVALVEGRHELGLLWVNLHHERPQKHHQSRQRCQSQDEGRPRSQRDG